MRREFTRKVRQAAIVCQVRCAHCGIDFDRGYRISANRAAKPQYCSTKCRSADMRRRSLNHLTDTFWQRASRQSNGCLIWQGRRDVAGYGRVDFERKPHLAHRIAFLLTHGELPSNMFVCHSCDTPACIEPTHLWLGTQSDNMADAAAKSRLSSVRARGEDASSKLTEAEARSIKFGSEPAPLVAKRYGITRTAVYAIRSGKNWGWLT